MNNQLERQLNAAYRSEARNESRYSPLRFNAKADDQFKNGRKLGHGNVSTFNPLMPDAGGPVSVARQGRMLGHGNRSYNPINPDPFEQRVNRNGRMLGHGNRSYNPIGEQRTNSFLNSSKEIMRSSANLADNKVNFYKNVHNFYGLEDHRPPTTDIINNSANYSDPSNIQAKLNNYSNQGRNEGYSSQFDR